MEETIIIPFSEFDSFIKQAVNLTKRGYDVEGISKNVDGELSLFVKGVEDATELLIDANLLKK